MSKLKVAIVGAGFIVQRKHIGGFKRLANDVDLAAICDVNLSAAKEVAAKFSIPRAYGDLTEMLEVEHPDLVDICTPPATHLPLALTVIQHGCNLLVEKPMALTVDDCQRIIDAAKEAGVKICVGHNQLFYPSMLRARELVKAGAIGELRGMRILLSTPVDFMTSVKDHWAHKLPGGLIGETGPHMVYLALSLINPIVDVEVMATKLLPEYPWSMYEDYRVQLRGERAVCSATITYSTNQWLDQVDLFGTEGMISADLLDLSVVTYRRTSLRPLEAGVDVARRSLQLARHLGSSAVDFVLRRHLSTHDRYIQSYVEALRRGLPSPVPGEMGRDTIGVLKKVTDKVEARAGQARQVLL